MMLLAQDVFLAGSVAHLLMAGPWCLLLLSVVVFSPGRCAEVQKRLMRSISAEADETEVERIMSHTEIGAGAAISPRLFTELPEHLKSSMPEGMRPFLVKVRQLVETNSSVLSSCMTDRVLQTLRLQVSRNTTAFIDNLAPDLRDAYREQKKNPGMGCAVLMVGQVRTGTSELALSSIRDNVFKPLLKRNRPDKKDGFFPVHVFAFLEFTSGGYQAWQHVGNTDEKRDFTRAEVEAMLKAYGAPYSLEEADGKNRKPDYKAAGCYSDKDADYGGDGVMSEQWYKVHAAIEMMREYETAQVGFSKFQYVVRIRPDIRVENHLRLDPDFETDGIPFVCASGGGGADCLMTMKRWAAEALTNTWKLTADCPMSGVDDCHTKELIKYCKGPAKKRTGYTSDEICDHYLWLSLWRQGVAVAGCGAMLDFVRPPMVR